MEINDLVGKCGQWLRGSGPESDIVISSRVRLARNLAEFPFVRRANNEERTQIVKTVHKHIQSVPDWSGMMFLRVGTLKDIDRHFLVERQLMSLELAEGTGDRAVAIDHDERFSIMINEEDHLRIQVMCTGLDVQQAWKQIDAIDDLLQERLNCAFHEQFGYLTACPTNVGTGLRVSVMLHLPALVVTREIEKVFRSLQKINVTVRGLYGEGSQFMGDFYQVSNQITLGRTEDELVQTVSEVVPRIIEYERKARQFLLVESEQDLHDDVSRAYGILCTAKKISSEETLHYLSKVRMGVNLGLIQAIDIPTINKLFVQTQPAHLQKLLGHDLSGSERNIERANYLQSHMKPAQG
ncbi:MAG: protein arginine kinase [Pirellulaceae bacterium]|nr:protein arginine kinase [Pirellulaceae bacterium]